MINSVTIHDLVIVRDATFEPGEQLTAVTGETGAGKTLLATAIDLLFGGATQASQVAADADHAFVEGEFTVPDHIWATPEFEVFRELRPEPDAPLVLARKILASGRSRALAWGRAVTRGDLEAAGQALIATAGQHVQRRLTSRSHQRRLIDASGGTAHEPLVTSMADKYDAYIDAVAELERLQAEVARLAAEQDELADAVQRIAELDPSIDDEQQLVQQRRASQQHHAIVTAASQCYEALSADGSGINERLAVACQHILGQSEAHERLSAIANQLASAQTEVDDVTSQLSVLLDDLHEGPQPIDEIEARLSVYDELKRRHGGTVESLIDSWNAMSQQLQLAQDGAQAIEQATAQVAATHQAALDQAAKLSEARSRLATKLSQRVQAFLDQLGMAGNKFGIQLTPSELTRTGCESMTMLLSPTPDSPQQPIAKVASGGELSRISLALLLADDTADADTIIFDEIDTGVGGHTAHEIATLLKQLGEQRQVICITHLAQVAARAHHHVVISKRDGSTQLDRLRGEPAVIGELMRMMGADAADENARRHAEGLRGPRFLGTTEPVRQERLV